MMYVAMNHTDGRKHGVGSDSPSKCVLGTWQISTITT